MAGRFSASRSFSATVCHTDHVHGCSQIEDLNSCTPARSIDSNKFPHACMRLPWCVWHLHFLSVLTAEKRPIRFDCLIGLYGSSHCLEHLSSMMGEKCEEQKIV